MAASSNDSKTLIGLVVLRNTLFEEKVRSVHVYLDENGDETIYEREYLFHKNMEYKDITKEPGKENRLFVHGLVFDVKKQKPGLLTGTWECIFVFDRDTNTDPEGIPDMLLVTRNPKLAAVPSLVNDLDIAFSHKYKGNAAPRVHLFDLNSPASSDEPRNERQSNPNSADVVKKKHKRITTEDIARLGIEEIANYFHLPIVEASKKLNVGLTVLKRKCREFGIPRWPHRKIKSLDGLINNLQEAARRKEEDEAAAMAVAKRKNMIEREKERIEKQPFLDIKLETKKFRQDVFKRRHEARILEKDYRI